MHADLLDGFDDSCETPELAFCLLDVLPRDVAADVVHILQAPPPHDLPPVVLPVLIIARAEAGEAQKHRLGTPSPERSGEKAEGFSGLDVECTGPHLDAAGTVIPCEVTLGLQTELPGPLTISSPSEANVVCSGVFTDQCVSSTVRSLADESFNVVVVEDCCAAGSEELHHKELEILNMIYCSVMSSGELKEMMGI